MATVPSIEGAFSMLAKGLRIPQQSTSLKGAFTQPVPFLPSSANMSTVNGPVKAPAPVVPTGSMTRMPAQPTLSAPAAPRASAPAMPSIAAPATPPVSPIVQTPSGATVNADTGGLVSPPPTPQLQQATPQPLALQGGLGGMQTPLQLATDDQQKAFEAYMAATRPEAREMEVLAELGRLNAGAVEGALNIEDQAIALPFITGQQASLEKRRLNLARPLESEAAILQAKRTIATDASKFALERADKRADVARETEMATASVPFGSSLYQFDPATRKYAPAVGAFSSSDSQAVTDSWVNLIKGGQAKLEDVPQAIRQSVAENLSGSTQISKANQDAIAQANTVIGKIDEILPTISGMNTGFASYANMVRGTPQYNLATQLDTIKSNVGFAALQAMRAASPTGGALGQVSEQENRLLQSTLASLDQGQSAEQLKANLAKVKLHFENLKRVLNAPIGAQVSYDSNGNVVIHGTGGGGTAGAGSSSGGSSLYDF